MRNNYTLCNKEEGKRCFIIANGPSVRDHDLSLLKNEIVIGMNASTILDREYDFFTKYYVLTDARFLNHPIKRKYATINLSPKTIRVLRNELFINDDNNLPNATFYVKSIGRDGFSFNIHKGFYFGCTTTMLAIQLAATLGCSYIYLLGLDLSNYIGTNTRFYKEVHPQEYDLFISTQIYNICRAYEELSRNQVKLYHCNQKSLISPYIPFYSYKDLF